MPSETAAAHAEYLPGAHVLIDFWGARRLDDPAAIEKALRDAAETCGATVLDIRLHQFGQNNGVTGVALLSESHISIHTWPETGYAALDVFMCGLCRAEDAVPPLKDSFLPTEMKVTVVDRGKAPPTPADTMEIASQHAPTPDISRSRP